MGPTIPSLNNLTLSLHNWLNGIGGIEATKTSNPIRFGVLGAADFSPVGLFDPARTHPDVVVTAIGARSLEKAQKQAKQHGIPRAFGSYQEVIELEDLDAVYIPLPINKHAEWAIKAARAGKHVLVEKPIASNQDEAMQVQQCAQETGKVILEAFHWQFHPANHVLKAYTESQKYGNLLSVSTRLFVGQNFGTDDIRVQYSLSGGASMDLSYVYSAIQYFVGADGRFEVTRPPRSYIRTTNSLAT